MSMKRRLKRLGRPLRPYLGILSSLFFSQYGEDALLFIGAKPSRRGFYVDIGAYHPIEGSNTYKLYLRGWHGLTIEPNPSVEKLFRRLRPRDLHVVCGVSKEPKAYNYYEFEISMLNTMSAERAELLQREGYKLVRQREISSEPLSKILARGGIDRQIDLMSVDCEGFDLEVLESMDFAMTRPTLIIVEDFDAFVNLKMGQTGGAISDLLRGHGYVPVYQAFYSTLYVAKDWRVLNAGSGGIDERRLQPGILP